MSQPDAQTDKLKVFISYSRLDVDIADQIRLFLDDDGFDPIIDRQDIDPAERWKERVGDLLFRCDTVVFVLSKRSAGSPTCQWEVEEAERLGKRMIAVLIEDLDDVQPPAQLIALNYIFLYAFAAKPGSGFYTGSQELGRALKVNLPWLRFQTYLSECEARHDASGSDANLLRGDELEKALAWKREQPKDADVGEDIAAFLQKCQHAEAKQKAAAQAAIDEREAAVARAEAAVANEQEAMAETERANATAKRNTKAGLMAAAVLTLIAAIGIGFAGVKTLDANDLNSQLWAAQANQLSAEDLHAHAALMALNGDPEAKSLGVLRFMQKTGNGAARAALESAKTHNPLRQIIQTESPIFTLAVNPKNGTQFVTGHVDGDVRLWELGMPETDQPETNQKENYHLVQTFKGHKGPVKAAAFHPDGQRILTGSWDKTAKLWKIGQDTPVQTFKGHEDWVAAAAFHPDGQRILTGSTDKTAKLWKIGQDTPVQTFKGHEDWVAAAAFHPDGQRILTGSTDKTAKLWKIGQDTPVQTFKGHENSVRAAAFHPDGQYILTGSDDTTAKLWKIGQDTPVQTFKGHEDWVAAAAFHPDGQRILTGSYDTTAKLWKIGQDTPIQTFKGHEGRVAAAAFHPDGQYILTGSDDKTAKLWKIGQDAPVQTFKGHEGWVAAAAFHPDGQRILTGSTDKTAKLWKIGQDTPVQTFKGHEGGVRAAAFHPDGQRILTGSHDTTAKLWDIRQNIPVQTFKGHEGPVYAAAFHSDGQYILTGSADTTAKLWDIRKNIPIQTFTGHEEGVWAAAFHPDGQRILTGSNDTTAKLWDIDPFLFLSPEEQVETACQTLLEIGMPYFTQDDVARWPILQGQNLDPCNNEPKVEAAAKARSVEVKAASKAQARP